MGETEDIKGLLAEIRDAQREHLAEYRKVTQRSLELQQQAVDRQEQLGRLYRRVVIAGAALVLCILIIIVVLMGRIMR
jgi:CHASE3 domain sensor protein